MKFFLYNTYLIGKKIIFIGIIISFSYVMADDFDLPNHDEIKKEVNSLIEFDQLEKSKATVLQKIKNCASQSDGYIVITRENAPNIYKLLNTAAKTIGIEIPLKVYLNDTHALTWNCCNAFVAKNHANETYLSIGSKFLCELTEQEIKSVLEHEFMHIKDKFLEQLTSKMRKNLALAYSCAGALGAELALFIFMAQSLYSAKYSKATLMALSIPLLHYLLTFIASRAIDSKNEIYDLCKTLEQNADLNVESKTDLANGLKKIIAMVTIEALKYNPKSIDPIVISVIETEMQNAIIKNIDNGKIDSNDPLHPTLQNRLNYLKESTETPTSNIA